LPSLQQKWLQALCGKAYRENKKRQKIAAFYRFGNMKAA